MPNYISKIVLPDNTEYMIKDTHNFLQHQTTIIAKEAIQANRVIHGDASGYKMLVVDDIINLSYPILFTTESIAINGTTINTYEVYYNMPTSGFTGSTITLNSHTMTYLVGSYTEDHQFRLESPIVTTTLEAGKYYIPIGISNVTDGTELFFSPQLIIYYYNGENLIMPVTREINGVEFIRGTWTAASNVWTGASKDNELYDGKQILLYMPFGGTSTAATLNLTLADGTTTGAKDVYYENTTHFTTHKGQNSQIPLIYHKDLLLSNGTHYEGWWFIANRDTNDNYRSTPYYYHVKPYTLLGRYQICLTKDEEYILPINNTNNNMATTKTLTSEAFDPFGPIFYYNSTAVKQSTETVGANVLIQNCWGDIRYSFNTGQTLIPNKAIYIVAVPLSNGFAKLDANPISQTLPTTEDGKIYIFLGVSYSNCNFQMVPNHPVYYYKNNKIQLYSGIDEEIFNAYPTKEINDNAININDGAENIPAKKFIVDIKPIQSGSGAPSPTNIRTISPRTTATIKRFGKNILSLSDNSYTPSGMSIIIKNNEVSLKGTSTGTINRTIGSIDLLAGVTYTISGTRSSDILDLNILRIDLRNTSGGVIASGSSYMGYSYTPTENVTAQINIRIASGQTLDCIIYPRIEIGNAMTWEVNWENEAGAIYGGLLDTQNGTLTVDRILFTIDGSDNSRVATFTEETDYNRVQTNLYNDVGVGNILFDACNNFEPVLVNNKGLYKVWNSTTAPRMFFGLPKTITNIAEAKAWFAENPTQVVARIASPVIYNLTPLQIKTLLKECSFSADAGPISIIYYMDPTICAESIPEFIMSTNAAQSNTLTGTLSSTSPIKNGKIIYYMTKYALLNQNMTLTLKYGTSNNDSGAIPIYSYGTTRCTTAYPALCVLSLVYYNGAFYIVPGQ